MNGRTLALCAVAALAVGALFDSGARLMTNPGFWTVADLIAGIGCFWIAWEYIWTTVEVEIDEDPSDDVR